MRAGFGLGEGGAGVFDGTGGKFECGSVNENVE